LREEKPPSFVESFKTSLEITADSPTLKAIGQAIGLSLGISVGGPLGGSISGVLSQWVVGRGDKIGKERLEEFLILLAKELKTLEGQAVKKDYFDTPEGYDLLIKALDEARKTRSKEKRELYARILKGAVIDFEQKKYSAEEYLHLIADLTLNELKVARVLYEVQCGQEYKEWNWDIWSPQREEISEKCSIDVNELSLFLNRIASTGLIDKVNLMYPGTSVDS